MKLTCLLIVAMLFLMACQLITAEYPRKKQGYSAVRSRDKIQRSDYLKLTKRCTDDGDVCEIGNHNCCSGSCLIYEDGVVCGLGAQYQYMVSR
uniref:Conotoxin n=1 Tax=Conus betulinus TaxID=89764 RepID=A0A142C1K8_CONBE|nr:conotoxin [Conus betulinus]